MIKAVLGSDKKTVVVFGLSQENCRRLLAGDPLLIRGAEVGLNHDVLILGGADEATIIKDIRTLANIPKEETEVYSCCAKHAAEAGHPFTPNPGMLVCPDDPRDLTE